MSKRRGATLLTAEKTLCAQGMMTEVHQARPNRTVCAPEVEVVGADAKAVLNVVPQRAMVEAEVERLRWRRNLNSLRRRGRQRRAGGAPRTAPQAPGVSQDDSGLTGRPISDALLGARNIELAV